MCDSAAMLHFLVKIWFIVFYVHLLSLAKDMKLGFYIFPTGNRTPGHHLAVHYTTAAPRQFPIF